MAKTKTILHVLYSGLGGHGNVFFSFIDAAPDDIRYKVLFYGIEDVREEYVRRCTAAGIPWQFVKKTKKLDLPYYKKIWQHITESGAQVVFLHSGTVLLPARFASLQTKQKIIVRETQANHLKTKWEWLYLRLSLLYADAVVFLTTEYKEEVKQHFPLLFQEQEQKVSVISNGLDMKKFQPVVASTKQYLTFGMQSRLVNIKDYPTLLRAFALFRQAAPGTDAILKIAGDGPEKESLQQLTSELNLANCVQFAGLLNEEQLVQFLQTTDIYIHATLGETMSTAIMQAMACRLPIIASDVKGVNNMISDGEDGLLVPPQNDTLLAEKMGLLSREAGLREKLSVGAYQKAVREYSNHRMNERYMQLIKKLTG